MKKKIFKANIGGQVILIYRRKRLDDQALFDSIMKDCKPNGRSPNKELTQRLKEKTGVKNEADLLLYLKGKAVKDFGIRQGNLQEVIWGILRKS